MVPVYLEYLTPPWSYPPHSFLCLRWTAALRPQQAATCPHSPTLHQKSECTKARASTASTVSTRTRHQHHTNTIVLQLTEADPTENSGAHNGKTSCDRTSHKANWANNWKHLLNIIPVYNTNSSAQPVQDPQNHLHVPYLPRNHLRVRHSNCLWNNFSKK